MPRERTVTMGKVSPQESHKAAIRKAVKKHRPYEVVDGELLSQEKDLHYVVYCAPLGGDRRVIANRSKKPTQSSSETNSPKLGPKGSGLAGECSGIRQFQSE